MINTYAIDKPYSEPVCHCYSERKSWKQTKKNYNFYLIIEENCSSVDINIYVGKDHEL
jgi:hypothetical protein